MAKQASFIKLKGRIGDLSFYKSQDGHIVREKGGVDARRIQSDPAFRRTRENMSEFSNAGKAAKLMSKGLRLVVQHSRDGRMISRLTRMMAIIKNYDSTSKRGERKPGIGIQDPEAKALLQGFNFNSRSTIEKVLFATFDTDPATGVITIPDLKPAIDMIWPEGATHFSLTGAMADINFEEGSSAISLSEAANFEVEDTTSHAITLTPATVPTGTGIKLCLLLLQFFQEVNGVQYVLSNGAYNALAITEVV